MLNPLLLLGVFLLSFSLLALEILLVRLVSILYYPIATYLVISLALLGFGVSGTALALRHLPGPAPVSYSTWGAAGFSVSALAAYAAIWFAPASLVVALSLPIILGLPFALGGMAIAVALNRPEQAVSRVYFADLAGAGAGAGALLLGLRFLTGPQIGALIAAAGLLAAGAFADCRRWRAGAALAAGLVGLAGLLIALPPGVTPLVPKELRLFTELGSQVRWEYQGWNPLARLDVLSLPGDKIRLPGPFNYKLVTQDGGAPTLLLAAGDSRQADFAEHTILGVPYWIRPNPSVFIVGLGGGPDVQTALHYEARAITGVEINPQMIRLVRSVFAAFTGDPYSDPRVRVVLGDGRHVLRLSPERYDIVRMTGVDTSVASPGASPNLAENYLYTVEAFREYLQHLAPDGLLSISFPDMEGLSLRLQATALVALADEGAADPPAHLVVSRSGGFAHMEVKRSPFNRGELATLRERFAGPLVGVYLPLYHRLFGRPPAAAFAANEIVYDPFAGPTGGPHGELAAAFRAGEAPAWLAAQTRDVRPATDDRPFFFVLDRWGHHAPNLEALAVMLALLGTAAGVFLIVPLLALGRRGLALPGAPWLAVYFTALGIAYIAIEVNLIQKLSLFLGHPSYALATALGGLLAASGVGSLAGGRWNAPPLRKVVWAAGGVATFAAIGSIALTPLFDALLGVPLALRALIAVAVTGAPGLLMGIPFPSALAVLRQRAPAFVPWAWALNGTGTVLGTIAALLVAMQFGFSVVFGAAAGLYLLAAGAFAAYLSRAT